MAGPEPDETTQVEPPLREIPIGLAIGFGIGLAVWLLILVAFGGAGHHFSFA